MRDLDRDEHHLLDWLGKADHSLYGECHGPALSALFNLGLAKFIARSERGKDWDKVALTEHGWALLAKLGPWQPRSKLRQAIEAGRDY